MLYGLGSTNRLYTIDLATGMARPIGNQPFTPALEGVEFGFDFNPTVDRIRIVTNSVPGATTTTLYTIDAETRALQTQIPPNDGRQNRVGILNIDMSNLAGFDISPTTGMAYVASRVRCSNASVLYQINLTNATSLLLGIFDKSDQVSGLALPNR